MDKIKQRFQLLSLLIIFFIYRALSALFANNLTETIIWALISGIYGVSLLIAYLFIKRSQSK
ncbi:MAG: hypothetical protein ACFFKA_01070 [Candidatus Thorarchaeota archaeon]